MKICPEAKPDKVQEEEEASSFQAWSLHQRPEGESV